MTRSNEPEEKKRENQSCAATNRGEKSESGRPKQEEKKWGYKFSGTDCRGIL